MISALEGCRDIVDAMLEEPIQLFASLHCHDHSTIQLCTSASGITARVLIARAAMLHVRPSLAITTKTFIRTLCRRRRLPTYLYLYSTRGHLTISLTRSSSSLSTTRPRQHPTSSRLRDPSPGHSNEANDRLMKECMLEDHQKLRR